MRLADLLLQAWAASAAWIAAFLDAHPDATPEQLVADLQTLNPTPTCPEEDYECGERGYLLEAVAVQLETGDRAAWVVSERFSYFGTFFVIARGPDGHFRLAWHIKDLAAAHFAARDELGYWAYMGFGWGDGPLVGNVSALPRASNGRPRFYVDALAAALAGGTTPSQVSVWEWDGAEAKALVIKSYQTGIETEGTVEFSGDLLKIPTKEPLKAFYSCGSCSDPVGEWRIRIAPERVEDLGHRFRDPELELVDTLFHRVLHGRSTADIAAPAVADRVRRDLKAAGKSGDDLVGMLGAWNVQRAPAQTVLCVSFDDLPGPYDFTVVKRKERLFLTAVKTRRAPCPEPPEPTSSEH